MYRVEITVGANASKYWAKVTFEDAQGTVHERKIDKEHAATVNSNYLQASIDAVSILTKPCMVDLYAESEYVVEPFKQGWIVNWEKNDWMTAKGKPVRNVEQWKLLRSVLAPHSARFFCTRR